MDGASVEPGANRIRADGRDGLTFVARSKDEVAGFTRGVDLKSGWRRSLFQNQISVSESQRDSIVQPKVATQALPWVQINLSPQPQRGLRLHFTGLATGHNFFRVVICFLRSPRVAPSSQPWAEGGNPFGIFKSLGLRRKPPSTARVSSGHRPQA